MLYRMAAHELSPGLGKYRHGVFRYRRDGIINNVPGEVLNVSNTEFFHDSSHLLNRLQDVQLQLKENIE